MDLLGKISAGGKKLKSYFSEKQINDPKPDSSKDNERYWIGILEERFGENPLKKMEEEYKGRPVKVKHKTSSKNYVDEGILHDVLEDFIYIGDDARENFHLIHWDWGVPPSGKDRHAIYSIESDLTIIYKNNNIDFDHENTEKPGAKTKRFSEQLKANEEV